MSAGPGLLPHPVPRVAHRDSAVPFSDPSRLLTGVLDMLQSVGKAHAYEEAVQCFGYLARSALGRESDEMPLDITSFFHHADEAYTILGSNRGAESLSGAA
ncbi:hypothetical protein [Novosphingobium beihaiensis]|uniref:Uncharacterized protein n=1 Tax=Novosphingobium beihaiensis TaxID=2930389 RepID=A0ABT0BTK0_9SPHN|nr:hypothetical protein [Novosphingobium beihaiensis]MCJ2188366.1 hypothetical protein [Novosphingobium beihaiensis]